MNYKKKGKNSISRNISESDLKCFAEYDGSTTSRNKILYKLGVDTSLPIETLECQHRNLQGKVHDGVLFLCFERLDREWCKSGFASLEAFLYCGGDDTMAREINEMNKGVME